MAVRERYCAFKAIRWFGKGGIKMDQREIKIRMFKPGDASYISYLHAQLYKEEYEFKAIFEYYVMKGLAEFIHNPDDGQLWVAEIEGKIIASIAIVKAEDNTAQLRWFLVVKEYQELGIGKRLIKTALDFCRQNKYGKVFLWTTDNLHQAHYLYEANGFKLVESKENTEWSDYVLFEERWDLTLND